MKLTKSQQSRFDAATSKLPPDYSYELRNEQNNGFTGKVWGVSVYLNGEEVGLVTTQRTNGTLYAHTTCGKELHETVKRLLNRAAAALWHEQPNW